MNRQQKPFLSIVLAGLILCTTSDAQAKSSYQIGYDHFIKKDYKGALPYLAKSTKEHPKDSNCLYYYAVTLHHLGRTKEASDIYKKVLALFPGTLPAMYAKIALKKMDPAYLKEMKDASAADAEEERQLLQGRYGGMDNRGIDMPTAIDFAFQWYGNKMLFSAQFDQNLPGQVIVDPTANENVIGTWQLKTVNPRAAANPPAEVTMAVQIGNMSRPTVKFKVDPARREPAVIGKAWTESYDWKINRTGQLLHMVRIGEKRQIALKKTKQELIEIPFYSENGQMSIDVDFGNGARARCHIALTDPSAPSGVKMTKAQFTEINPPTVVEGDPETTPAANRYGVLLTKQVMILKQVRVSSILRDRVPCLIEDEASEKYPDRPNLYVQPVLPDIGPDIFAGWDIKVDGSKRVIRLTKTRRGTTEPAPH